ncbi:MAG: hypothetical protein R2810_03660 [Flavobacteriales bacterium]
MYHGTKFAVEGISEALSHELKAIGVQMKINRAGLRGHRLRPRRSFDLRTGEELTAYQPVVAAMMEVSSARPRRFTAWPDRRGDPSGGDGRQRPAAVPLARMPNTCWPCRRSWMTGPSWR